MELHSNSGVANDKSQTQEPPVQNSYTSEPPLLEGLVSVATVTMWVIFVIIIVTLVALNLPDLPFKYLAANY